jgi:diaminopimelate epimerase dapF
LFWERSCASGTSALGAAFTYAKQENLITNVKQPGGILKIETFFSEGDLKKIVLNGEVEIVAQGTVYV